MSFDRFRCSALAGALSGLLSATLAGCAPTPPPEPPVPKVDFTGFYSELKPCRDRYREIDAKIDAAGVRNPAYYRVPGFPYFRTDRLLASYRNEVHDINEVGGWVRHLRELDQEAREFEYENLGMTRQEIAIQRFEFLNCGRGLSALELDDPEVMKRLLDTVNPPGENSGGFLQRIGLAGLLEPLLRDRVLERQSALSQAFQTPLPEVIGNAPVQFWQVAATGDPSVIPKKLDDTLPDELGLPGLFESAWVAIAEANAPRLLLAQAGEDSRLGTPVVTPDGIGVDVASPRVDYQIGFTRFGGRALIQVFYFVWLKPERAGAAGLDGFVWRATLDENLQPLVYDAVRSSGLDHVWFPVQGVKRREPAAQAGEPALLPQAGPAPVRPVLVLDRSNYLRRVVAEDALPGAKANQYALQRYEDLSRLRTPGGGARNLFAPDGALAGGNAPVNSLAILSGIPGLGLPRHVAHLPGSLLASRAFDDPAALDEVFERLGAPRSTAAGVP